MQQIAQMSLTIRNDTNTWQVQVDPTDPLWNDFLPPSEILEDEVVIPDALGAEFEREWPYVEKLLNSEVVDVESVRDLSCILSLPPDWILSAYCNSDDLQIRLEHYEAQGRAYETSGRNIGLLYTKIKSPLENVLVEVHKVAVKHNEIVGYVTCGLLVNYTLGVEMYMWHDVAHIRHKYSLELKSEIWNTIELMNDGYNKGNCIHYPIPPSIRSRTTLVAPEHVLERLPIQVLLLEDALEPISRTYVTTSDSRRIPQHVPLQLLIVTTIATCIQLPRLAAEYYNPEYEAMVEMLRSVPRIPTIPIGEVSVDDFEAIARHMLEALGKSCLMRVLQTMETIPNPNRRLRRFQRILTELLE